MSLNLLRPCRLTFNAPAARSRVCLRRVHQGSAKDAAPPSKDAPTDDGAKYSGIPGPSWLQTTGHHLASPFRAYGRVSAKRPYMTQFISSLIVYSLGDLSSQYITQRGLHPDAPGAALVDNYQSQNTLRAFGAPAWVPFSNIVSLATRIVVNQCLFAPIFNVYFFSMQSVLSGAGAPEGLPADASVWDQLALESRFEKAKERIVNTVPTSWVNSWKFWPFVTAFSFTFIPIRHRSIFAGCAAVVWQSYLCLLNTRHAAEETEAEELPMGA